MVKFADGVMFTPTLGGTTDWTVSAAVQGYMTPALGGMVNGGLYRYRAESLDQSQWEIGFGTYTSGTGVLTRTAVTYNSSGTGTQTGQTGAGTKINFTVAPTVSVVLGALDVVLLASNNIVKQVFTASGTYTPTPGMLFAVIECVGSGGGGAGCTGTVGQVFQGGGGGSGGYSKTTVTAATVGASQVVTVGAAGTGGAAGNNNGANGNDVSVGALCVAKGGSGGLFANNIVVGKGGVGGVAGTGDITATGSPGAAGFYNAANITIVFVGGFGGSSYFGGGAAGVIGGGSIPGTNATNYGGGGSGGFNNGSAGLTTAGGNGSLGVVHITEYCGNT